MNILVVPEDFCKDQYLLKPLFERLFRELGKAAARVVCQDPLLGGIGEALKSERLAEVVDPLSRQGGLVPAAGQKARAPTLGRDSAVTV